MTSRPLRVLIVGGYGTFGSRLVKLLAEDANLHLIVAGRSLRKAKALCAAVDGRARLDAAVFDRDGDPDRQLRLLRPHVVIDASGPFQAYGPDPYRLARAALSANADYIDLADGAAYVAGIAELDSKALDQGRFVLSGASTCPVLTFAAAKRLAEGLACLQTVTAGIAPSPRAQVGLNVVRALAAYAGKPVKRSHRRRGAPTASHALTGSKRYTIGPPGALPLYSRRFSLVEVPDLELIPARWPELNTVWVGAGSVPALWLRMLNGLSWLVRLGLIPTLAPLAPLFHGVIRTFRWGEHRGGMFVAVEGRDAEGRALTRSWELIAEGDSGPFVPAMPAALIVQKAGRGERPSPGARPAAGELDLRDFEGLFARQGIATGLRERTPHEERRPLYARVLGEAWDTLPAPLRVMHAVQGVLTAQGRADVQRGSGLVARLAAWMFGFPWAGNGVPVEVRFETDGMGGETWHRSFAGRQFRSHQRAGTGRSDKLVCERFGAFVFSLAAVVDRERLRLIPRRWSMLGIPLPRALAPRGDTYEYAEEGRFCFHVEIALPLIGLIVRYQGYLVPCRD
jgi:hypothetical protein